MMESNMFDVGALQHAPVVRNTRNDGVYEPEHFHRSPDVTNWTVADYEYSQPVSAIVSQDVAYKLYNPFGTPAQVALLFLQSFDSSAFFQMVPDSPDTNPVPHGVSKQDIPGFLFLGPCQAPMNFYWMDFQNYVNIKTSGITGSMNYIIGFRRKRDVFIPTNKMPFNEPSE